MDDIFIFSAVFLLVGVLNVISSLWVVNDLVIIILLYFFYCNWAVGIFSVDVLW